MRGGAPSASGRYSSQRWYGVTPSHSTETVTPVPSAASATACAAGTAGAPAVGATRGAVDTAAFRRYRLPQYADVPRTEVHFMETADAIGPLGAESLSESPFNPVAPALANALRDVTGVRFTELPLTRDRVWLALDAAEPTRANRPARSGTPRPPGSR